MDDSWDQLAGDNSKWIAAVHPDLICVANAANCCEQYQGHPFL
jgi:hypothetical protein